MPETLPTLAESSGEKVSLERGAATSSGGDAFVSSVQRDVQLRESARTQMSKTESRLEVVSSFTRSIKKLQRYENIPSDQQMRGVIRMRRKNTRGVIQSSSELQKNYDFDAETGKEEKEATFLKFNLTLPSPVTGQQVVSFVVLVREKKIE